MTHQDHIEDRFSELLDGTLSGRERDDAHAHRTDAEQRQRRNRAVLEEEPANDRHFVSDQ